jgi:hypothetical protein
VDADPVQATVMPAEAGIHEHGRWRIVSGDGVHGFRPSPE